MEIDEEDANAAFVEVQQTRDLIHENLVCIYQQWIEEVRSRLILRFSPIKAGDALVHSNGIL